MLFMHYEVVFNVFIIGSPYICETKPKFYNQNGYWCLKWFHQSQLTTNIKAVLYVAKLIPTALQSPYIDNQSVHKELTRSLPC
jgi:hypothetical protein